MARRVTPWNPNTADWLVAQRGARTQDQVVADLAARGVAIKRAWLSRIENGAQFGSDLLAALQDYYKSVPPPFEDEEQSPEPTDYAAVVAAIDRQTDMLRAVLFTLAGRTLSAENQAWAAEQIRATSTGTPLPTPVPENGPAQ